MNQLDMLSRNDNPQTSRMAAKQLLESGALDTQRDLVHDFLAANEGLTSRELADLSEGDVHQQRQRFSRRLGDLKNMGLARQGEIRVCAACNRKCVTWYLTEEVYND